MLCAKYYDVRLSLSFIMTFVSLAFFLFQLTFSALCAQPCCTVFVFCEFLFRLLQPAPPKRLPR